MVQEFIQNDPLSLAFFQLEVDRVALVKDALRMAGGNNRATAITLLQRMKAEEQKQLFPELIQLARAAHGPVRVVRDIILSLPRQWVLAQITAQVEAILRGEEYDDYWMFLELYQQLDPGLAVGLARRVANHADPDIRELGFRQLARLMQIAAREDAKEEGEAIRKELGPIWRQPIVQVRKRLNGLAEDLSALAEGEDRQADMTPAQEEQYREEAKTYLGQETGDVDAALAFLRLPFPRSIRRDLVPFLQARYWEKLGDLESALLFMKEAERHDPSQAISVLTLLPLLQRMEEMRQYADRILNYASTHSPEVVYLASAVLLMRAREMSNAEARPTLERIITPLRQALEACTATPAEQREVADLDRQIIKFLGFCYERLGDEQKARECYGEGLARYPNDAGLLTFRGITHYRENPAAALHDFAKAADQDTSLVLPYYFLAWHAIRRSAYRQALIQAVRGSRRAAGPSVRAELHEMIAIARSMLGESLQLVREHFEQAIALDPTNKRIRRNREIAESRVIASSLEVQPWEESQAPDLNAARQTRASEIEDKTERIIEVRSGRATKVLSSG